MRITSIKERMRRIVTLVLIVLFLIPVALTNKAFATEQTLLEGKVSITDNQNSNTKNSDNAVTITVSAALWSSKTNTVTIANESDVKAKIGFQYTITGHSSTTFPASSGTLSYDLDAGDSVQLTFTAKASSMSKVTATLKITNLTYEVFSESSNVTFNFDNSLGSISVNNDSVEDGDVISIPASGYTISATTTNETDAFIAWIETQSGLVLSRDASHTLTPASDMEITAVFASSTSTAWFSVNGAYLFNDLNAANQKANGNGTIVPEYSGTLSSGNYIISSGVTLLIPFDNDHTLITDMGLDLGGITGHNYPYLLESNDPKELFLQLTMLSEAAITVESGGAICVGSKAYRQMTGQAGPYGAIVMEDGSSITIKSSATLYAWGYLFPGSPGSGTVTVESGGTVYENLTVVDYTGSASSIKDLYDDGIFPLRAYTFRNVEVPITYNSGAYSLGFFSLYGSSTLVGYRNGYANIIGNSEAFFQLTSGTMEKVYSNGVTTMTIDGNANLNPLNVNIYVDISSSRTTGVPMPSGFEITLNSGKTLTMNDNFILMEGTKLTIEQGATVNTNGYNVYVMDATDDPGAKEGTDLHGAQYTKVNKDAVVDVNGTVLSSGGFYTSTNGAQIVSSEGTGKIIITGTSALTAVNMKASTSTNKSVSITPAQLMNSDGSYVQSETNAYVYMNEKWMPYFMTNVNLGNNLDIYFAVLDYGTNTVTSLTGPNGDASSLELIDGTEIGLNSYKYIIYSGLAAKNMTDLVTLTVNNSMLGTMIKEDSIRDYAVRMMNKHSSNTQLCTMLVDMLNYGAACQTLFDHYTNDLANAGVDGTGTTDYTLPTALDAPSNTYFDGSQLVTTGNIQFAVKATDAFTSNLIATYSYKDHWGQTISGNLKYNSTVDVPYYYIDDLVVADAKSEITITVNNVEYKDSIEAYCARMYSKSDATAEQKEVFLAFMKFSTSARNYLEGDNKLP